MTFTFNNSYRFNSTVWLSIFITSITLVCYNGYWDVLTFSRDDHFTISGGYGTTLYQHIVNTIDWLVDIQSRYQPFRLSLFVFFIRTFPEEYSVYYNIGLHIINLLVLIPVLRKFNLNPLYIFIIATYFSLFGRNRYMDSASSTIAGAEMYILFILLTLYFLIKAIESTSRNKKIIFLTCSYLLYLSIVFSYEVAYPFFLLIVFVFIFFNYQHHSFQVFKRVKEYLVLVPYLLFLIIYLFFFRLPVQGGSYGGSTVTFGLHNLLQFQTYFVGSMTFQIRPGDDYSFRWEWLAFLFLYYLFLFIFLSLTKEDSGKKVHELFNKKDSLNFLLFSALFFFTTIILFSINKGIAPGSFMAQHAYSFTFGSSLFTVSLLFYLQFFFPAVARQKYIRFLIYIFFPLVCLIGLNFNLKLAESQQVRSEEMTKMKMGLREKIKDIKEIDAIIIKNFKYPYYYITSVNAAFIVWFDYSKYIH
ncbi:MAG: hypothetical protein HQK84_04930, partial [Nitrospinae bacterium]|nr:hypothetical protein [Nitrospinota bacterium]